MVVKAVIISTKTVPGPPKPKRLWDNYEVVGEVMKSDRIKIVVAAAVRDGVRYLNIREFYLKKSESIWKPGRDGITIPLEVPISQGMERIKPYEGFRALLNQAVEVLQTIDLYNDANAIWYIPKEKTTNENQ